MIQVWIWHTSTTVLPLKIHSRYSTFLKKNSDLVQQFAKLDSLRTPQLQNPKVFELKNRRTPQSETPKTSPSFIFFHFIHVTNPKLQDSTIYGALTSRKPRNLQNEMKKNELHVLTKLYERHLSDLALHNRNWQQMELREVGADSKQTVQDCLISFAIGNF